MTYLFVYSKLEEMRWLVTRNGKPTRAKGISSSIVEEVPFLYPLFEVSLNVFLPDKPFKTYSQQIEILKKRNLIIDDTEYAEHLLKTYSYYDLVNGNLDKLMVHRHPDKFQDGISIQDLVKIRVTEDRIKSIFLKQILMIEKSFKTSLSYYISKNFGVDSHSGGYLTKRHYSNARGDIVSKTMKKLRNIRDGKVQSRQGNPIIYYREHHNHIPPWILIEELTLGQTIYWYKCLKANGKKTLDDELLHLPSGLSQDQIANLFLDSMNVLREFRNFFAHNSVLSHMQSKTELDLTLFIRPHEDEINLVYNIPNNLSNSHNLVACFLSILVLSEDFVQAQIFINELKQTMDLLTTDDEAKFIFESIFHLPIPLIENGEKFINQLPKFI
ncbi:hypothetical protein YK48G_01250 [Lentilactobacillus fungorum]|uniref:Abortive infection bacteriophage resistance protein n=1 Tax=Lentilactobacillus fungorum TaxID=2201250 RepID=A0ABQ3VUY7_9LACO|nr:Abi family protein [Lentilactobacillus fungorum]GHP12700.1 hypothetical protein YK48G_01250 [Lentilactobacillus fungorum]